MNYKDCQRYPRSWIDWVSVTFDWLVANFFWGSFALIIGMLVATLEKGTFVLPKDFVVGVTVMALTIAATNANGLDEPGIRMHKIKAWCRKFIYLILVAGSALALLTAPGEGSKMLKLNDPTATEASLALLLFALAVGYWAHLVHLDGRDEVLEAVMKATLAAQSEGYAKAQEEIATQMQTVANKVSEVDGVRF